MICNLDGQPLFVLGKKNKVGNTVIYQIIIHYSKKEFCSEGDIFLSTTKKTNTHYAAKNCNASYKSGVKKGVYFQMSENKHAKKLFEKRNSV